MNPITTCLKPYRCFAYMIFLNSYLSPSVSFRKVYKAVFQESPFQGDITRKRDSPEICFFHAFSFLKTAHNSPSIGFSVALFLEVESLNEKAEEEGEKVYDF